jgi:hypothetical protein
MIFSVFSFSIVQTRKRKSLSQKIHYDFLKFIRGFKETPKAVMKRSRRIFAEVSQVDSNGNPSSKTSPGRSGANYNSLTATSPYAENALNSNDGDINDNKNEPVMNLITEQDPPAVTLLDKIETGENERDTAEEEEMHILEIYHGVTSLKSKSIGGSSSGKFLLPK